MKFEKINENKLKIFLNSDELPKADSLDELMSNTDRARNSFLEILNEAYNKVGFDTNNYKIKIDAKSMVDGTFILTVTRVVNLVEKRKKVKPKKIYKKDLVKKTLVYSFNDIDEFLGLCHEFKNSKLTSFDGVCSRAFCYKLNNQYFLIIEDINQEDKNSAKFFTTLVEFCTFVSDDKMFAISIKEHGKLFIKNNSFVIGQSL